jgi:chromodomain-helicase-DNA-binding protein 1
VQDFGQFDDDKMDSAYYVDPQIQYKEEDEIEAVLNHTRDEGREHEDLWFDNIVCETTHICRPPLLNSFTQRFHIKWKNFSHLHNTDETYEFLKRFRGLKRVDNYIKAYKMWQARLRSPGLSREDAEALLLDKEREKEEHEQYKTVERIVAHREAGVKRTQL